MKQVIVLAIVMAIGVSSSQAQLFWSQEFIVADGSQYSNQWPRIELANGNPVVVWGDATAEKIYTTRWNGFGFDNPTELTIPGMPAYVQSWVGPDVATRGNDVIVAYKLVPYQVGTVYARMSNDGGMTWGDTVRAEFLDSGFALYPTVTIKPDGNPCVMWLEHDQLGANPKYVTMCSTDGGQTFQPKVETSSLASGGIACECCPGTLISNGSHVAAMFRNNDNNLRDMWLAYSSNGGTSFSGVIDYDNTNWAVSICPSSAPDGYLDGDIVRSVFMSGATTPSRIFISEVDLATQTLITDTQGIVDSEPTTATQNYPRIAGSSDTLGIVWEQNQVGSIETVFTYSTSGVSGIPTTYDTVAINSSLAQQKPDIAYDSQLQMFHFVYRDGNTGSVVYRAASFNPLGIEQIESGLATFELYPNPVDDGLVTINVDTEDYHKGYTIEIYTTEGRKVRSMVSQNQTFQIDVSELTSGSYILRYLGKSARGAKALVVR